MTKRATLWVWFGIGEQYSNYACLHVWTHKPKLCHCCLRSFAHYPISDIEICESNIRRFGFPMPTDRPLEVTVTMRPVKASRKTTRATVPKEKR